MMGCKMMLFNDGIFKPLKLLEKDKIWIAVENYKARTVRWRPSEGRPMWRLLWLAALAAFSAWCTKFSFANFSKAFPTLSFSVTTDRASAEQLSAALITQLELEPRTGYRTAASFDSDSSFKTFLSLFCEESRLKDVMDRPEHYGYELFYWTVRFFREEEISEVAVTLSPSGTSYHHSSTATAHHITTAVQPQHIISPQQYIHSTSYHNSSTATAHHITTAVQPHQIISAQQYIHSTSYHHSSTATAHHVTTAVQPQHIISPQQYSHSTSYHHSSTATAHHITTAVQPQHIISPQQYSHSTSYHHSSTATAHHITTAVQPQHIISPQQYIHSTSYHHSSTATAHHITTAVQPQHCCSDMDVLWLVPRKYYGFSQKLPEAFNPDKNLNQEAARSLAVQFATGPLWSLSLNKENSNYSLVEEKQDKTVSGRVDWTFVWERSDVAFELSPSSPGLKRQGCNSTAQAGQREGAKLRVSVQVAANQVTGLLHFAELPEWFPRMYREMRSSNELVASICSFAMFVLFGMGGCVVALGLLLRQGQVAWGFPGKCGVCVGSLAALTMWNSLPLDWMQYETSNSSATFLVSKALNICFAMALYSVIFTLTFTSAEAIARLALPQQLQVRQLWGAVGGSAPVLEQTVVAYLMVPIWIAYEIALYSYTRSQWGWWVPTDSLSDPNVLSHYLPWFSPLALSLMAGTWEEALFRMVPIAGAMLLSQHYHLKPVSHFAVLVLALFLQAVVFGGAHANYPSLPMYGRLVELILPSFGFAFLFLYYGCLTGMLTHFAYDAVLMAMPLFQASGSFSQQGCVIVVILIGLPLWLVLLRVLQTGCSWPRQPAPEYRNQAFSDALAEAHRAQQEAAKSAQSTELPAAAPPPQEAAKSAQSTELPAAAPPPGFCTKRPTMLLLASALCGVLVVALDLWPSWSQSPDLPPLLLEEPAAAAAAASYLTQFTLDPRVEPWTLLMQPLTAGGLARRFVWDQLGEDVFRRLSHPQPHSTGGTFLQGALWVARAVQFEGAQTTAADGSVQPVDVVDRAEEWKVLLDARARVVGFGHEYPRHWPGSNLTEEQGKALAETFLLSSPATAPHLNTHAIDLVSAVPVKQPFRTDWGFTYRLVAPPNGQNQSLLDTLAAADCELRMSVSVVGLASRQRSGAKGEAHVNSWALSVHVPEAWTRANKEAQSQKSQLERVCQMLLRAAGLGLMCLCVYAWATGSKHAPFPAKAVLRVMLLVLVAALATVVNSFHGARAFFSSTEPYQHQCIEYMLSGGLGALFSALCTGLMWGALMHRNTTRVASVLPAPPASLLHVCLATVLLLWGVSSLRSHLLPNQRDRPVLDEFFYASLDSFQPFLARFLADLSRFQLGALRLLTLQSFLTARTSMWSKLLGIAAFALIQEGMGVTGLDGFGLWLARSAVRLCTLALLLEGLLLSHPEAVFPIQAGVLLLHSVAIFVQTAGGAGFGLPTLVQHAARTLGPGALVLALSRPAAHWWRRQAIAPALKRE
eukprot:g23906.t1